MENCEAMTSSTHSFAYSYRLVKKCFLKLCKPSTCHNLFTFQLIFIRFSLSYGNVLLFILKLLKLNLFWISPLKTTHCIFNTYPKRFFGKYFQVVFSENQNLSTGEDAGWDFTQLLLETFYRLRAIKVA